MFDEVISLLPGLKIFPYQKQMNWLNYECLLTDTNNENLIVVESEITILTMIMNNNVMCVNGWMDGQRKREHFPMHPQCFLKLVLKAVVNNKIVSRNKTVSPFFLFTNCAIVCGIHLCKQSPTFCTMSTKFVLYFITNFLLILSRPFHYKS